MAAALSLDSQLRPPHPPLAETSPNAEMAAHSTDGFLKPSMPRPIPAPVTIPPRTDDHFSISPQPSPRLNHAPPPPMPEFVFPARSPASAPSSYSRATGRRPRSVADLQERTPFAHNRAESNASRPMRSPALPDFVFNPGASLSPPADHAFLSPPLSPASPRTIPSRPPGSGHRRGGSEFVGGSIRDGDASVMGTSPTKSESGLSSPPPGAGRRGHAHRRSAAISIHDLSGMLQPSPTSASSRGSSAPSSPATFMHGNDAFSFPRKSEGAFEKPAPEVETPLAAEAAEASDDVAQDEIAPAPVPAEDTARPPSASKPNGRARVGFSDTLEFIPRPLSLISTDTSSTVTVRPTTGGGHSVSGSISSIISLNTTSSVVIDHETMSPVARSLSRGTLGDSRPSTAGAVLDRTQSVTADNNDSASPRRRNSIPLLAVMPAAETATAESPASGATQALPSPSKVPKRWSFFSLDPFMGNSSSSSLRSQPAAPAAADETATANSGSLSANTPAEKTAKHSRSASGAGSEAKSASTKTIARKTSKKKKKAKSWGILTRKSKPRRKSRRAPTPPPIVVAAESDEESVEGQPSEVSLGETNEGLAPPVVLVTPSESTVELDDASIGQPLPSPSFSVPDDDTSFAMIDLDAALGPFNTPLPRNPEWEAAQRAGGLVKRQLHSAAGMTRFSGPGMHYNHRRAESAPEMPPFNRAGLPRYSSSTAMADVFEEDEEDGDEEDGTSQNDNQSRATSVHSSSAASTPAHQPADGAERPPSIDIRVTLTDSSEDVSADRIVDMSAAASDDATSSVALSRRGSGVSGVSDDDRTQPSMGLKSEYSASSLHDDVVVEEEEGSNHFTFAVPDSGCDFSLDTSSDSTVNSPSYPAKGKNLAPVQVDPLYVPAANSLTPVSPYSMGPSSGFPSPRSPMSYDANRISTAPSSVTEDNFQSLLLGEPGPEVRISLDIPSLTSSNSTMTRESGIPQALGSGPQPRPYLPSRNAERPVSFTSAAFGRRRSSLASLHRLISTSHGERSKLSIEVQPDNDSASLSGDAEKRLSKTSRAKRLSRLVQFWKKEDTKS